jgi:uncharacterized membrane protein YccC
MIMKLQDAANRTNWVLPMILSVGTALALGLALVWINIERTNLGYTVRRLTGQEESRFAHAMQLEVERDRLLSPYVLHQKAAELGMQPAKPGQNRRMGNGTLHLLPR